MNKDFSDTMDFVLMLFGGSFALTDIRNILSIAILAVEAVWFTIKLIFMVRDHIKEKNAKGVMDDIDTYANDLKTLVDKIDAEESKAKEIASNGNEDSK